MKVPLEQEKIPDPCKDCIVVKSHPWICELCKYGEHKKEDK